jgi:hypothetical protein
VLKTIKSYLISPTLRRSLAGFVPKVAAVGWRRYTAESLLVLISSWLLLLPYLNQDTFLDEFDNMVGGNVVAHGGAIYVDYWSQHTPVSYWLSALGHVLGGTSVQGQRLFGFGIFAFLLALLYFRNAKIFGRIPLLIVAISVPLMHFANPILSYAVLSDNYQALAGLFLLFEVVRIGVSPDDTKVSWVFIGVFSAFSFGVAFVSVFFIAAAVITATLLEVINFSRIRLSARSWFRQVGIRCGYFIAPFFILIAPIWLTGSLTAAFEQAYVLNTTTYAKYLGGFGSSAGSTLLGGPVTFWETIVGLPTQIVDSPGRLSFRVAFFVCVLLLACFLLLRVRPMLALGIFVMATYSGLRGWAGFHAQPLWAYLIGCFALLVWLVMASGWLRGKWSRLTIPMAIFILVSATILSGASYAVNVFRQRDSLANPIEFPNPARTKVIETLVPEGEKYADFGIDAIYDFVQTRRLPAGGFSGVVPWFLDTFDAQMTERLADDNPVLVFADSNVEVWGHKLGDHGPRIFDFIDRAYRRVNLQSIGVNESVYIRTDVLDSALKDLRRGFPGKDFSVQD